MAPRQLQFPKQFPVKFKGWTIPGPHVPGHLSPESAETLDSISGHFKIFQLKEGHRFSTDDVLTAWYGVQSSASPEKVLDLGSGIGSVAMIAAWKLSHASFVTIEAQEESFRLSKKSAEFNGLTERFDQRCGDFRDSKILHDDEKFDLILGSPPYFPLDSGVLGDHPQKIACRFEMRGEIRDYCKTAASHLSPAGIFSCVFPISPPHQEVRVQEAARHAGLVILKMRPVILKSGEEPLLGLFTMMRPEDLPERLTFLPVREPPLVIREKDGKVSSEYTLIKLSIGFPP